MARNNSRNQRHRCNHCSREAYITLPVVNLMNILVSETLCVKHYSTSVFCDYAKHEDGRPCTTECRYIKIKDVA